MAQFVPEQGTEQLIFKTIPLKLSKYNMKDCQQLVMNGIWLTNEWFSPYPLILIQGALLVQKENREGKEKKETGW